jgi:hypothetical protein
MGRPAPFGRYLSFTSVSRNQKWSTTHTVGVRVGGLIETSRTNGEYHVERPFSARAGIALDIIAEAGNISRHWFEKASYRTDTKPDGSPVTQADLETEAFIRAALAEHFPADAVLGEEMGESAPGATPTGTPWWPVDTPRRWSTQPGLRLGS